LQVSLGERLLASDNEVRRPYAGSVVSRRIRADSASGTPSRSTLSSACLKMIGDSCGFLQFPAIYANAASGFGSWV
jgi:hypothetical protein